MHIIRFIYGHDNLKRSDLRTRTRTYQENQPTVGDRSSILFLKSRYTVEIHVIVNDEQQQNFGFWAIVSVVMLAPSVADKKGDESMYEYMQTIGAFLLFGELGVDILIGYGFCNSCICLLPDSYKAWCVSSLIRSLLLRPHN